MGKTNKKRNVDNGIVCNHISTGTCGDTDSKVIPHDKTIHSEDIVNSVECCRCGKDLTFYPSSQFHYAYGDDELILCDTCYPKLCREINEHIYQFKGRTHFENAANEILAGLEEMGFEPDADNFKNTPKRFSRAYQEIFEGVISTEEKIKDILSTTFPANGDDTMVVAKDIVCFSMCPHHLLPVEYHVCVGYIPNKNGQVLGISKLNRLVVLLSKQPCLQETFTQQIVNCLHDIGVYGAMALVEGQHMCMRMRGAKALNSTITTTAVSGIFADDRSTKDEFLRIIEDRIKFR